jgi:hypothetical protein
MIAFWARLEIRWLVNPITKPVASHGAIISM